VKAHETTNDIPRVEDTLCPDAQKSESTSDEPQSLSGTKTLPNLAKAPSLKKASPCKAIPSLNPTVNPQSSELAESPKTTPPSPHSHGLSSAGEVPIGGKFAQPQPKSLPR
jgi:hypothetical protein